LLRFIKDCGNGGPQKPSNVLRTLAAANSYGRDSAKQGQRRRPKDDEPRGF
jgi:hypothetical protein